MIDLQAIITGHVAGCLAKADHLNIGFDIVRDTEGNYLPYLRVEGLESGERLLISVETEGAQ